MAARRRRSAWWVVAVSVLAAGCGPAAKAISAGTVSAGTVSAGTGSARAEPHQSRQATPLWLQSMQMTSVRDGWAVSEATNPGSASVSPPLLVTRTSDGGHTWMDVTPAGARSMLATSNASELLDAVDGERAYFVVTESTAESASAVNTTVLFATSDAGRTWAESAPLRATSRIVSLSFADAGHGWLLMTEGAAMGRNPVRVYRTADGGRHWSPADAGIPSACDKTGMTFPATAVGWLASECAAASPAVLLVSRDGGATWVAQPLPVSPGVSASGPQFVDGTGFLTVGRDGGAPILLITTDLGRTWRRAPLPGEAGSYPQVKFFSPADGVLVPSGTQGSLGDVFYITSDRGQTWRAVPQGTHFTQLGVTIEFVSQRTGFAWILGADAPGASAPPIYETSNSGRTWKPFTPVLVHVSSAPSAVLPLREVSGMPKGRGQAAR